MKKLLILLLVSLLTSCSWVHRMDIEQGNIITPDMLCRLHVGMTKTQVKDLMGTPMVMNTFTNNHEEYVYTFKPGGKQTCEKYVLLQFDRGGRLRHIDTSGNI